MAKRQLLWLSICILLYKLSYCIGQTCIQEDPCLCKFINDFAIINLWPLANHLDGLYTTTSKNSKYILSICQDYNETTPVKCGFNETDSKTNQTREVTCKTPFSLCKCDYNKNLSVSLGSIKDRSFVDVASDPSTEKLVYAQENGVPPSILLACSQVKETFFYSLTNDTDQLVLFTHHACPIEEAGLSTGSSLLIVFFFFLLFYFVFGALLLHFIRGARGIEMIPNLEFWKDFPYLVRDGIMFLLNGCQPITIVRTDVYDRI